MVILTVISLLSFLLIPSCWVKAQNQIRFIMFSPNHPQVWDRAIADFEAQKQIKVIREIGPYSSTEYHALVTQKLKNRDPEMAVFFMDVTWPAEFAAAGWALL